MKKIKTIFLFLFIAFLCVISLNISYNKKTSPYIENMYIDATINEDGSVSVKEIDSYNDVDNGVYISLGYKNERSSYNTFTGSKDDFLSSSIYNGSIITDVVVGDISKYNLSFDSINKVTNYYEKTYSGYNGLYGYYEEEDDDSNINLKVYSPGDRNRAIYFEYKINDMVVKHNDISELAWTILSSDYLETSINKAIIKIHLPKSDSNLKAFGHGSLQGEVSLSNNKDVTLTIENMNAYSDLGVRILFSNDLTNTNKTTNIDAYDKIISIEEEQANKANKERNKAKILTSIIITCSVLWLLGATIYMIYTYFKYDKEYKYELSSPYYRDLPGEYPVYVLEYLLKHKVTELSFSTILLDLIRRKIVTYEMAGKDKKEITFIYDKEQENLTKAESSIIHLLFKTIGDGKKVSINKIRKYTKSEYKAQKFIDEYDCFKDNAKMEAESYSFFINRTSIRVIGVFLSLFGVVILVLNIGLNVGLTLPNMILVLSICIFIYSLSFKKKSRKGIEDYTKWMAFKKFLEDFGRFDEKELPEISLWEKYLVYAHILGCADTLEKQMKMRLDKMHISNTDPYYSDIYFMHDMMRLDMHSAISHSLSHAVHSSTSTIAASRASSVASSVGSDIGSGGGFSGGGGSFGGGGGRGGF